MEGGREGQEWTVKGSWQMKKKIVSLRKNREELIEEFTLLLSQ